MLDIDTAIKHCLEVAEQNEISAITYKNCKGIKANMYEKLTAEKAENDCRECAAEHRQLAEWLKELKEAKRLLKLAILDIYHKCGCENSDCDICVRTECDYDDRFIWRYKDEVFKIIDIDKE